MLLLRYTLKNTSSVLMAVWEVLYGCKAIDEISWMCLCFARACVCVCERVLLDTDYYVYMVI